MTTISRLFIKSGIVYFLAGIFLAFLAELPFIQTGTLLLPVYWHMLVIGWVTQVIMGVSIWMFPRKKRDQKKKENVLVWAAFWTLNTGLILRFISEPFLPLFRDNAIVTYSIILSSILQLTGVMCYIAEIWPRVQPKKTRKKGGA